MKDWTAPVDTLVADTPANNLLNVYINVLYSQAG